MLTECFAEFCNIFLLYGTANKYAVKDYISEMGRAGSIQDGILDLGAKWMP